MPALAIDQSVLVVDDDEAIRVLLRDILEERGCLVFEAANGKEALAQFGQVRIDLLIIDLIMPEKEGIETIREVRALQPDVKILAISGAVEASYLQTARLLGADQSLRKPFAAEAILRLVEQLAAPADKTLEGT